MRPLCFLASLALTLFWAAPAASADTGQDLIRRLKQGLIAKEPVARQRIAVDVGRFSGHLDDKQKKRAAALLNKAFAREQHIETRRVFVRAMARLRHQSAWIPVLNAALGEGDDPVRATARLEVFRGGADLLDVAFRLIDQETSASYRAQLVLLLGDRRRRDAVPRLLPLLRDKQGIMVAAVAEALEALTGEAHGYDPERWISAHEAWMAARPENGNAGPSVAPGDIEAKEPTPHITRSLHPSFYGLRLTAKDVVFVIDLSGSVGPGGITKAKRELVRAVELLGSDVRVAAVFFAETVQYWNQGRMVHATPRAKEELLFFLKGLEPGRKSDVFTAFNAGLRIVQKRLEEVDAAKETLPAPATLIAVSDGNDNVGGVPLHVIEDRLDRLDLERTVVHSVVLGGKRSRIMEMLATYGGGHLIPVAR